MPDVTLTINGVRIVAPENISVASAIMREGNTRFRTSVTGQTRAPLCGMGICFECRVTIDGHAHQRSCIITVREGMVVQTT